MASIDIIECQCDGDATLVTSRQWHTIIPNILRGFSLSSTLVLRVCVCVCVCVLSFFRIITVVIMWRGCSNDDTFSSSSGGGVAADED